MLHRRVLQSLPLLLLILSACTGRQDPAAVSAAATAEADPCSSQNLPATVQGINDLMREFDAASARAPGLSRQQLPELISDLQGLRRTSEDLPIPPCLATLKQHQLNHMNLLIQALLAYVGGADQATLNSGLQLARAEHDRYSLEIVRLLGITLAPVTVTPATVP